MNEVATFEGITQTFQAMLLQAQAQVPKVLIALLVLVIGWFVAKLLRMLLVKGISRLDRFWQRFTSKQGLTQLQPRQPPTRIVGELVFWLFMLIVVTLATEILGLAIFGAWLMEIVAFLPLAVGGVLIVLVGFVVSSLVRDLVTTGAASADLSHSDVLGRTAQIVILLISVIIGIEQVGFDTAFLTVVAGILLATTLGGFALAFGLGSRIHVSNIIAANQLRSIYQVGDRVRIGTLEGRITDIGVSRVMIETESGSVDVPAKIFDEEVTTIVEKGE